ncbi:hypothetical protein GW17_00061734 [Ensete ventricosum]|nr:hypothetical protein GW17_00061734 [Ensete ventricosum]
MHPLKFPNSGIRAKVFVRKIGFKLRVIRLYRVESFYAFFLRFRSEGSEEEGQLATANPYARPTTHGQASCKGLPAAAEAPLGCLPATRPQGQRLTRPAHIGAAVDGQGQPPPA